MKTTHQDILDKGYKTYADLRGWEKSYIFLRWLVNKDRYGGLSDNPKKSQRIVDAIFDTYALQKDNDKAEITTIIFKIVDEILQETKTLKTSKQFQYDNFVDVLKSSITVPEDFLILAITIQELLLPTNEAISRVPSAKEIVHFARIYGKVILDEKQGKGLSTIIRDWDLFTEALALNKERDIIVDLVSKVRTGLQSNVERRRLSLTDSDMDILLTGLCQEFERRAGQKRKQRAGEDLESVMQFIFKYYSINAASKPEHFLSGLEVDTWVKDSRGWYIGISLKRTLRERWKQTYISVDDMNRLKIKHIVHVINNDFDLSDSKLSELAGHRHLFFMADTSKVLNLIKDHIALGKHVFPMSNFITELKKLLAE